MSFLFTLLTGSGTTLTRPLAWLGQAIRHPLRFLRTFWPFSWSRRTVILLVMQTLDNAIRLRPKRRLLGRGVRLQTEQDPERPNPTFIPAAEAVARWMAEAHGRHRPGRAHRVAPEHPDDRPHPRRRRDRRRPASSGVVDGGNRVFGYENLLVCDGAAVPANPGVNPSLTITALAERAMAQVPSKPASALIELPDAARPAAAPAPASVTTA